MALQLGFASADHLLDQLSPTQWAEWVEFARLEPFGSRHSDTVQAVSVSLQAQFNRYEVDADALLEHFGHLPPPAPKLTLEEELRQCEAASMLFSMALHGQA